MCLYTWNKLSCSLQICDPGDTYPPGPVYRKPWEALMWAQVVPFYRGGTLGSSTVRLGPSGSLVGSGDPNK